MLFVGFGAKTTKLQYGRNSWPVRTSDTTKQNFSEFFFSFERIFPSFLGPLKCYLQVLVQKCLHCIPAEILDESDKREFSYKLCPFFFLIFFYRIFHVYLRALNIVPTCFQAKMATLHYGWNSWLLGTSGIFVQNLQDFFLFQKNFPFYSWTTKYAVCKFWRKNANIVFRSKFFTSRTKGHFRTNFALIFF